MGLSPGSPCGIPLLRVGIPPLSRGAPHGGKKGYWDLKWGKILPLISPKVSPGSPFKKEGRKYVWMNPNPPGKWGTPLLRSTTK